MFEELVAPFIGNLFLFSCVVFLFCALWGDASLIFFVVFAINYSIPLTLVLFFAYFGSLFGDTLWFVFGIRLMKKFRNRKSIDAGYKHIINFIEKNLKNNHLLALILVKFLYGTRVITTIYLSDGRMCYKKFMKYNFIATFVWIVFMGAIGYLVAIGFEFILNTFKNIQLAVTGLIIFLFLLSLVQKLINNRINGYNSSKN
jgi:membrane protein DedA with SNARE-associated domain